MIYLTIISFISVLLFLIFSLIKGKRKDYLGMIGEYYVDNELELLSKNIPGKIINNLIINNDYSSSQIDHIFICRKGIFVFETKNYSGSIIQSNNYYWIQKTSKSSHKFYNPIFQNYTHIRSLTHILGYAHDYYNVVIFVKNNINSDNKCVFNLSDINSSFLDLISDLDDVYDDCSIDDIYKFWMNYKFKCSTSIEHHIKKISSNHSLKKLSKHL